MLADSFFCGDMLLRCWQKKSAFSEHAPSGKGAFPILRESCKAPGVSGSQAQNLCRDSMGHGVELFLGETGFQQCG